MRQEINPSYAHLSDFVATVPQKFKTDGTLLFKGRNTIKKFVVGGESIVVKRFKKPNLIQRVVYGFFRKSKARRAYLNGGRLIANGISTPVNIAYIEQKSGGLLEECYYLSGEDNAPSIEGRLNETKDFDKVMATDLACFAADLHRKGILHDDFNCSNVLYHPQSDGHYHFSVIDINRMRFTDGYPSMAECMENLTRFTGRMDLFEFVATAYVACRGLDFTYVGRMLEVKRRHDKRWRQRKAFTTLFKKHKKS